MNATLKAHGMLILPAVIGGVNFSISKLVMPSPALPLAIVFSRGLITILVYHILHALFIKEKIQREDFLKLVLPALFGISLNQISLYEGLNLTKPINASLLATGTPLVVLILSLAFQKEKLSPSKIGGLLLGLIGSILLLLHSGQQQIEGMFTGDLLILLNSISWALYIITVKPLLQKYHPLTILKWIFTFGILFISPLCFTDFQKTEWNTFTTNNWFAFSFIVLGASITSYYLNTSALKYVNPSTAGSYFYLLPVISITTATIIGIDNITLEKAGYFLLILTGIYFVSYHKRSTNAS